MREFLFRAKRTSDQKWVQGNLFLSDKESDDEICVGTSTVRITYPIDRNTVGQYTGLTDKNGTKIFEGDIVRNDSYFHSGAKEPVKWMDGTFMLADGSEILDAWSALDVEVIGNIHDNPELLEAPHD